MTPLIPGLTGLLLLVASAHGDDVRHASAHTHGVGEAILTLQGETLSLQMYAPLANFSGRDETSTTSANSIDNLTADLVVDLPESANCTVSTFQAQIDNGTDEHHHAEDQHEADDDHSGHSGHADVLVTLNATCTKPDKIRNITFTLFDTWSGFTTLKTTFLTETGATAKSLTKASSKISRP